MSEKKAVVLLSGGLDSFVTAGIARDEGYGISLLTINYRQRHNVELGKAEKIAAYFGVDRKQILIDLISSAYFYCLVFMDESDIDNMEDWLHKAFCMIENGITP